MSFPVECGCGLTPKGRVHCTAHSEKSDATPTYVMVLRSVGNPDYAQYTPISEPRAVKGKTIRAMVRAAQEYQDEWNLGGGNWPDTEIRSLDGKSVGWISYNGRVWDSPNDDAKEIALEVRS